MRTFLGVLIFLPLTLLVSEAPVQASEWYESMESSSQNISHSFTKNANQEIMPETQLDRVRDAQSMKELRIEPMNTAPRMASAAFIPDEVAVPVVKRDRLRKG